MDVVPFISAEDRMRNWMLKTMPGSHAAGCSSAKALWALCWRMLLLTPIVAVFGTLALAVLLGLSVVLPFYAVLLLIGGDHLWALLSLFLWLVWLRFGGPVRRYVFEGFEHGSL